MEPFFKEKIRNAQAAWRRVAARAVRHGLPVPALAYYDGLRWANLPANLIQAQRDCFGAHPDERVDRPQITFFPTEWIGSDQD